MRHATCIAFALTLALSGCDLSNELFEEDQLFVRAVPTVDDVRTEHPTSRDDEGELTDEDGARGGDFVPAAIPPQARAIAEGVNGQVFYFLGLVQWVRNQPITTRGRDRRIWGPYPVEAEDGDVLGSVRMVVTRDPDAPRLFEYVVVYSWDAAEDVDEETEWDPVLYGEFSRGGGGGLLREGVGSYCFEADLATGHDPSWASGGRMCVEHQRIGDRITLWVELYDWLLEDGSRTRLSYFFNHREDRGGVLEYVTREDLVGGDGLRETLATRVRWRVGGPGRADLLLSGGSLLGGAVPATECWGPQVQRLFWIVGPAEEPFELYGDPAECTFPDREDVREVD